MRRLTQAVLCAAATAALSHQALAVSYASGLIDNGGGNYTFTLNESAQDVIIYRDGVPTSLGATTAGTVNFSLNGASNWQIQVVQSGGLGFGTALPAFATSNTSLNPLAGVLQSQADSALTRFNSPRGVDVNTSTSDLSLFGRVYVSNSANATAAIAALTPGVGTALPTRPATTNGIYVLDAKLSDILGLGDTARTGGIAFDTSASGTASPLRVTVGPDGSLYIADWSDSKGSVYRTDANVSNGSGVNLLAGVGSGTNVTASPSLNHGSIVGVAVSGSTAGGNLKLYTVDEDLQEDGAGANTQVNSVWRYDVDGNPTPYDGTPTRLATPIISFASQTADIHRGPDGKLYVTDYRVDGTDKPGLTVLAEDGTTLWSSLTATNDLGLDADSAIAGTQDLLRRAYGATVSPDGKYVALVRNDNTVMVLPIDSSTGLPDLSKRVQFNGFGTTTIGRDIAFDAAGNLYVVSSGYQAMRVFSPGGTSVTTLSSDGTFTTQNAFTPEWLNTGSGSTTTAANWPLSVVPGGTGALVKFGSAITAPSTVTIGAATTYGSIIFDNANSYTLSGSKITLDSPSYATAPTIYVASGNHTISAATGISRTTTVSVNPGSTLTLGGTISGSGGLTINSGNSSSGGNVEISATGSMGALTIRTNSTLKLTGSATNSLKVTGITTSSTSGTPPVTTYTGTFDVGTRKVLLNYSTTATGIADSIRTQIANGYASGAWNGQGISSSAAAADPQHIHAIGYAEAVDKLGASGGTWFGQSADSTALLISYTFAGDADLDLSIDPDDFALLDKGFANYAAGIIASGAAHWTDGDFNYDGAVNSSDYMVLDTTYGKILGVLSPDFLAQREAQFGSEYVASLVTAVPEPTTLGLLAAALPLAARRRRDRRA